MKNTLTFTRRNLIQTAAGLAATSLAAPLWAQAYPNRPVKLLSGATAGSASDIIARAVAEKIQAELGQPVIVEDGNHIANNRPYRYRHRTADWMAEQLGMPRI